MLSHGPFNSVHVQAAGPNFIEDNTLQFQIGLYFKYKYEKYKYFFLFYVIVFEFDRH